MVSYSELEKGIKIIFQKEPHEIIEAFHSVKGRGRSVLQAKLKNLKTGDIISHTFHPSDSFEEAEISKKEAKFLYSHKAKYFFSEKEDPLKRFDLSAEKIGEQGKFLKPNQIVTALVFKNKVINISLPIKVQLKVVEAPPGVKGDRSQSGNKIVVLETGAQINVPLFIEQGDTIEVNTETEEYTKRIN